MSATNLDLAALKKKFGTVEHNGTTVYLTEQAFNTNRWGAPPQYMAKGVDADDNQYEVYWDVKEEFYEMDDITRNVIWKSEEEIGRRVEEEDLCDWDDPVAVEPV